MDVFEAIQGRRSPSRFEPHPVPREMLERVLDAAMWAPSPQDMQNWHFVVLGGQEKDTFVTATQVEFTDLLLSLQNSGPWTSAQRTNWFIKAAYEAPVLVLAFSDTPASLVPDAPLAVAAAVQNLLLAAHAEGLAGRWFTAGLQTVSDIVARHIPVGEMELVGLIVLGYPAETPTPSPRREKRIDWRISF
ncbi:MAG: nitroreductase family protein [Anaerolineae bacterium]|nr:nitroreductase family protein [Anaerolineae bacterium]